MITDIIQNIINYSFIKQQILTCKLDSHTYDNIFIYKLKIRSRYRHVINQYIIDQKKFSKLRILKIPNVKKIFSVKGKNLFSLQPSATTVVSCKSSVKYVDMSGLLPEWR